MTLGCGNSLAPDPQYEHTIIGENLHTSDLTNECSNIPIGWGVWEQDWCIHR